MARFAGGSARPGGSDSPAASLAAEYLGLLTAGAIEIQPSVLLSEGRLSASGADELAPPRYEDVIRGLLDLGLPAGEPEQVATAVHGKPDVAAAVEQLAADQSQQEWVVLVEPGYLRDLTLSHTAEQAAAAGVALNITGYDLGLPLPTFRVEADPLLRGGCFRFLINRTTTPPVRGVPVDHLLVTGATSGQLAGGTETRECVFGAQSVLVPAVQRSVADELGLTAWDASTYLGLCLYWAVRRRARRLVDNVRVAAGLDHLGQQRPVQAGLARRQIPLPVLTRVLRELTEEYVPIRNLAAIVDLLLEYEACAVPERPSRLAWTRAGMQETIAAEFASGFRSITIQELPLDAQRLAVNWMSSGGTDDLTRERFLAALRTVVSVVPGAPMLVAGEARRAVYLAARAEFPDLRVLTAAELPPDFEVSQTDAGSMPSLS